MRRPKRQKTATKRPSPETFLLRSFLHIVPESLFVLLFTVWGTAVFLPAINIDASSATLFLLNWNFDAQGTDYYARSAESSPLLLYWSLAVIVQIYVGAAASYRLLLCFYEQKRINKVGIFLHLTAMLSSFIFCRVLAQQKGRLKMAYFNTVTWVWMVFLGTLTRSPFPRSR